MNYSEMIANGGKLIAHVGLQQRPVVEFNGDVYEKAIHFDDGLRHDDMYKCPPERAKELRELSIKQPNA